MAGRRTLKLTKKRAAWVAQRKPAVLKGESLAVPITLASRYEERLQRLVREMCSDTRREIVALFESPVATESAAMDASIASQARILTNKLLSRFQILFAQKAKDLAEQMILGVDRASKSALHKSFEKLSGGLSLNTSSITAGPIADILSASVTENVRLIKSIATEYLDGVQGAVMRSITTGNGLQDLEPYLKQHEGITDRRAKNIATDQTRKAYNSLNKGRMQAAGVGEFEWHHSGGGQRPREDHVEMDGNIYSFNDLPVIDQRTGERGIPGQAPNCRCFMVPVISFDTGEASE